MPTKLDEVREKLDAKRLQLHNIFQEAGAGDAGEIDLSKVSNGIADGLQVGGRRSAAVD